MEKLKDLKMMTNNIILGDCLDVLPEFPECSIDLVITDPPYGVNFENDHYDDSAESVFNIYHKWLKQIFRILKDNSHLYVFIPTLEINKWISGVKDFFKFNNLIGTQVYQTNISSNVQNNFTFDLQLIIYASKGKPRKFNDVDWIPTSKSWLKDKRNPKPRLYTYQYPSYIDHRVQRANTKPNKQNKRFHPNEKNPNLIRHWIEMSSEPDEIVLDPFCGSASTAVAAWQSNRKFIMIEKNVEYYKVANERLKKLMSQKKITQFR